MGTKSYAYQGEAEDAFLIPTWRDFSFPDSPTCEPPTSCLGSSYLMPAKLIPQLALRTKLIPTSCLMPQAGCRNSYLAQVAVPATCQAPTSYLGQATDSAT